MGPPHLSTAVLLLNTEPAVILEPSGRTKGSEESASPPRLSLKNRYAALSEDTPTQPEPAHTPVVPDPVTSLDKAPADTTSAVPVRVARHSTRVDQWPLSREATSTSASRLRIPKEAVRRRSGGLPRPEPAENPSVRSLSSSPHPH